MKFNRVKKASKIFENYIRDFNSEKDLRVLVDIGFAKDCSIIKLNITEKINSIIDVNASLYTTTCLLKECELMGHVLKKTYDVMKTFNLIECNHKYKPEVGAMKCVSRYLELWSGTKKNNIKAADHCHIGEMRFWSLATSDKDLIKIGQETVALPLFYFSHSCIQLLPYGRSSISFLKNKEKNALKNIKEVSKITLGKYGIDEAEVLKKRKKRNPNPLSIKKSSKIKVGINNKTGLRKKQMKVGDSVKIAINKVREENGLEPLTQFPKFVHYFAE